MAGMQQNQQKMFGQQYQAIHQQTTDSYQARPFTMAENAIRSHTTQKRCLLKPALSSLSNAEGQFY